MHHKPFLRRGDWIRTSDLLNPIQEPTDHKPLPHKADTPSPSSRCTSGCTGEGETQQTDPVAAIAAALAGLTPADRSRLAAMLMGQQTGQSEGESREALLPSPVALDGRSARK